jgi:tRNA 5-methylaminomethyl-2-thiouridine biosynthesis bifunctional protein
MAKSRPLTQAPAAKLDWSRPGAPVATEFGDIYFSTDGGLNETRAVFLEGCGLPEGWNGRRAYTIAELGFGSGLNFLAAWQLWSQTQNAHQRLHFVSIEKFPFDKKQLKQALKAWPALQSFSTQLIEKWPGRVKGLHRLRFGSVTLTLVHEDAMAAFEQLDALKADAWFLDGFSPSGNPGMWSPDLMQCVAAASAPGARLATFSVAGVVRKALIDAGFIVRKMPGFGRKRHRLEAERPGDMTDGPQPIKKALIVGAGIAGRSLAKALSDRQIPFNIIDDRAHPAASGNAAALVKPRFDLQDRPESRFFLSSYLYACRSYPAKAILSRGIRQLPKTEKEAARYQKLAEQASLGADEMTWETDSLWIENALVVDPANLFDDFSVQKMSYEEVPNKSDYSHVFLAAGYGIQKLAPDLAFRFSRGQLSWATPVWDAPTAYGGYAINLDGAALIGATHDRLDGGDPFALRPEDDAKNLTALKDVSGRDITPVDRPSRASLRVTTRDTLPIIAHLEGNIWTLSGLGSRGFTFAPLLAEALISGICNEVGPLDKGLRKRFSDLNRLAQS